MAGFETGGWYKATQRRRKYIPVGSLSPSMATEALLHFVPTSPNTVQSARFARVRWGKRREKPNPRLLWVLTLTDCRKLTGNTNVSGRRMMVE